MGNFATSRTTIGIAKEAVKGTGVAPTAFIPVKKFDPDPKINKLTDEGWRGSMGSNYGMQNGTQSAEVSVSGDCFADTVGYLLAGVLGDLATTGASAPYTHKMALLNSGDGQPKSYTLTDTQGGLATRQYAGCQFTEVGFKWDPSGLLSYDAKAITKVSATASAPTPTFGTLTPIANWLCALKFGAVAQNNIQSGEINLKRDGAEPIFTLGTADPYALFVGTLAIDGKFTFVAVDETPYTALAGNSGPGPITATFSQGANASVAFQCSNVQYDDVKVTRGKSYVEVEATWQAILNSTDAGASGGLSPALVTVINSLAAGTFG
jgi:hypothetical protein